MGKRTWIAAIGLLALCGVVIGIVIWARNPDPGGTATPAQTSSSAVSQKTSEAPSNQSPLSLLANGGLALASEHTGPIRDPQSLPELRAALQARGPGGLATLRAELQQVQRRPSSPARDAEIFQLELKIGALLVYEGQFEEAVTLYERLLRSARAAKLPATLRNELLVVLGTIAMRRGEIDNCIACVGPSSCIFPIAPEAVHTNPAGSREAIKYFKAYLQEVPDDLSVRWLVNVAHMTLGEYPDKVSAEHLIPLGTFESNMDAGRFDNVALLVGLTSRGPGLAGGSVFDDFTGDGLPDLFITSLDADRGASLYVNRGDGTCEDRSEAAGLTYQVYALNVVRADYDNDGDLDVLLLRGGWEKPMRLSLLRNNGRGVFEDVTLAAGLGLPISSESAAWGDYDNDGFVDLFVSGEYLSPVGDTASPDPRNHCRLYRNRGDGTFVDVASAAGIVNEYCSKGCAWGDYDGDGRLDLFVSNIIGPCRLFHNEGNGKFRDVAPSLGITGPEAGFACWFWDYDNDGRPDIYVSDYLISLADFASLALGMPPRRASRPHLYRNLGGDEKGHRGFREVSREVGLDRAFMPMGCNFGDVDNDGYLDVYLGTGRMDLNILVPNVMLKNVAGQRFEDITMSSGTGHLQKGHGISFADWDCDGDLDLFVEAGGGFPGDKAYNLLFQNPGHGRHWLKVKLAGTKTNRAALGARIKAVVKDTDGSQRAIYRTVGNNSSFGGNSLVELIGLADATSVAELEISWPTSRTTQTFRDVAADQMIVITEEDPAFRHLPQSPFRLPAGKPTPR